MIQRAVRRVKWLIDGRSSTAAVLQTGIFQALTVVANMATGILVARVLAPTGRGEVAAITLLPTILGFVLAFGIPSALLYNLKRFSEDEPYLIGSALVAATALGVIGMTVGYALVPLMLNKYPSNVIETARIFLLSIPVTLYLYVGGAAFDAHGKFWYANVKLVLNPILTLVFLCVFTLSHNLTPVMAALSYVLPSVMLNLRLLVEVVSIYRPSFLPPQMLQYRRLASYGFRSFGIDLLKTMGQQIDALLVVAFLSPAAMGLYAVALAVSRILQLVQTSVVRVLLARIAAKSAIEVVSTVGRAARVTVALTILPCIAVATLAPVLLQIAYGSKFIGATPVLRVLAIEAVFAGATWIFAQAFMALGKPGIVSVLQGIGLGLSIPLMVYFIPHLGLVGAALSLLISTLVRFIVVLACFPWLLHVKPPGLLLKSSDLASLRRKFAT